MGVRSWLSQHGFHVTSAFQKTQQPRTLRGEQKTYICPMTFIILHRSLASPVLSTSSVINILLLPLHVPTPQPKRSTWSTSSPQTAAVQPVVSLGVRWERQKKIPSLEPKQPHHVHEGVAGCCRMLQLVLVASVTPCDAIHHYQVQVEHGGTCLEHLGTIVHGVFLGLPIGC